jgi:undecaprenyl-diphosphatase
MIAGRSLEDTGRDFGLFLAVCIGTVPAVVAGLLFKERIESAFSSALVASILLLVTSAILLSTRFAVSRGRQVRAGRGFLIGCAQALAVLPGISRSGSTIAAALFCGVDREESFNFSFILSLPAIIGASVLAAVDMLDTGMPDKWLTYIIGMAVAFASGYLSLVVLKRLVVEGRFYLFGVYTLIVGLMGIIFLS